MTKIKKIVILIPELSLTFQSLRKTARRGGSFTLVSSKEFQLSFFKNRGPILFNI
jgi:hypothetical protein